MEFDELVQCKSLFYGEEKSLDLHRLIDNALNLDRHSSLVVADALEESGEYKIANKLREVINLYIKKDAEYTELERKRDWSTPSNNRLLLRDRELQGLVKEWEHLLMMMGDKYPPDSGRYKHIEKSGSGYDLRAKHGLHDVLGHHATREGAIKQEEAIEISKHAHGKAFGSEADITALVKNARQQTNHHNTAHRIVCDALEEAGDLLGTKYREALDLLNDPNYHPGNYNWPGYRIWDEIWKKYGYRSRQKALSAYQAGNGAELVGAILPKRRFAKSILEARSRRTT